jgi:heme a synthase
MPSRWPHRLALLTTGATFLLILIGGIVTNTESGLAVPDWPTTFGYNMFSYPLSQMVGGVLYEHSHRLVGSLVGLLVLVLAGSLWMADARAGLRWLGALAVAAVMVQGVLGGLRVVLVAESLAIVHGAFAHAFFVLVVCLALLTAPGWQASAQPDRGEGLLGVRRVALFLCLALYVQVILGALVTHLHTRVDAHLTGALIVSAAVLVIRKRIRLGAAAWPDLVRPARLLFALWLVQLVLGLGAYLVEFHPAVLPVPELTFSLLHRLTGALLLATAVVLTLKAYRRSGWAGEVLSSEEVPA